MGSSFTVSEAGVLVKKIETANPAQLSWAGRRVGPPLIAFRLCGIATTIEIDTLE